MRADDPDYDESWERRRARDPIRQARRQKPPPDVPEEELSDDPFIRAWQRWDVRPGDRERTVAFCEATEEEAERRGITASKLLDIIMSFRRAGDDYAQAKARLDLLVDN